MYGAVCLTIAPAFHTSRDYGTYAAWGGVIVLLVGLIALAVAFRGGDPTDLR